MSGWETDLVKCTQGATLADGVPSAPSGVVEQGHWPLEAYIIFAGAAMTGFPRRGG